MTIEVDQDADQTVNVQETFEGKVILSPNPVGKFVTIKGSKEYNVLSIYDQSGRRVIQRKIKNLKALDMSELQSGIYFVKLQGNTKSLVAKLIKL